MLDRTGCWLAMIYKKVRFVRKKYNFVKLQFQIVITPRKRFYRSADLRFARFCVSLQAVCGEVSADILPAGLISIAGRNGGVVSVPSKE